MQNPSASQAHSPAIMQRRTTIPLALLTARVRTRQRRKLDIEPIAGRREREILWAGMGRVRLPRPLRARFELSQHQRSFIVTHASPRCKGQVAGLDMVELVWSGSGAATARSGSLYRRNRDEIAGPKAWRPSGHRFRGRNRL